MDTREVRYEVGDRAATFTLDGPGKLNALTPRMRDELINIFDRTDADDAK